MILKKCQKKTAALRKKTHLAPVALCLGLFVAGCTLPDDEGDGSNPLSLPSDNSGGGSQYYLGYGYDVVKSSYVNRGDVKMANPILDQKKLKSDGMFASDPMTQQDFQMSVGSSVKKFYSNRNTGLGINVGGSDGLGAALFSGKFGFEFSVSLDENRIDSNSYLRGHSYRYTRDEYIIGMSAQILQEYLTDGFISDLRTRTAPQFLDRYGTHVIVRYYKGGSLEFNYAYHGKSLTTEAQMRAALTASFSVIKGESSADGNSNSVELERNSTFHYYTYGGKAIGAFTVGELKSDYSDWLSSIESKADICGIGDFDNSLVPVWELAEAVGLSAMAAGLESEFNVRAIAAGKALLVKKIKISNTAYTTSGSRTYTFNEAKPDSPAEIEVYALGAGGGGQGGHEKDGTYIPIIGSGSYEGTGAGGGGGAAAYMKLGVKEPIYFNITVGKGGAGGSNNVIGMGSSGESGYAGSNGTETKVSWASQNINLTAEGGTGGGGAGKELGGGTGGRARPADLPNGNPYYVTNSGATAAGGKGSDGSLKSNITSEGGKAAVINKGSDAPFAGGNGARRTSSGRTDAQSGGSGSGGYYAQSGSAGGDGLVHILVKYYVDE